MSSGYASQTPLSSYDFYTVYNRTFGLTIFTILVVIIVILIIYLIIKLGVMHVKPCSSVPSAPTGVAAGFIDSNSFEVIWHAIPDISIYTVYVGQTQTFTKAQSIKVVTTNNSNAIVSGLVVGRTYFIYVSASNACGESALSSEIQFVYAHS